jgi:hypothetical protein
MRWGLNILVDNIAKIAKLPFVACRHRATLVGEGINIVAL